MKTIAPPTAVMTEASFLPAGFSQRMLRLLGPAEYSAFSASFCAPRFGGLRWNPCKAPIARVQELGYTLFSVPWEPNGFSYNSGLRPGLHPWHDAGAFYLQEPSAMAPVGLLDIRPGQRVLDLCAAPGGKSTQLAAALNGSGVLIANEIVGPRARVLSRNIERMGVPNALVTNAHPAELARRFPGWFDRVLVDAPCSGEGMFRKEPAAAADWSEAQVAVCAARQLEILHSAAALTALGGRLVYSTCTFSPAENEGTTAAFLDAHPDYHLVDVSAPWFSSGRQDWIENGPAQLNRTVRLWPHRLRGEGHFAAVFERSADAAVEPEPAPLQGQFPPEVFADFRAQTLPDIDLPEGQFVCFGQTLYLVPPQTPDLTGLRVLRAGLELGQIAKNRFIPAHALALWLKSAPNMADFPTSGPEIAAYLRGETLSGPQIGWTLITADGLTLGWAKGSAGTLKNHYPKGLRRPAMQTQSDETDFGRTDKTCPN